MTPRVRRIVGTAIVPIVVLALAAACSSNPPDAPASLNLPSRARRDAAPEPDAKPLDPADTGPIDTGPPPDPFCTEPGLVLCFTFEDKVENLASTTPKLTPSKVDGFSFVDGKKNRAARLETGAVAAFGYSPLLEMQGATVEAWINRDLTSFGLDTVFDDDERFTMTVDTDGALRCSVPSATAKGGKVEIEQWAHVACVFEGATIKAYVGGAEVASAPGTIGASATTGAAIGDEAKAGGEGFAGEIDSLRVFNVGRTAAQISAAAQN